MDDVCVGGVNEQEIYRLAEMALKWFRSTRKHYSHNSDCWDFLYKKTYLKTLQKVIDGNYVLSPMRLHRWGGRVNVCWRAEDAFVLKFITLLISYHKLLPISPLCSHVEGNIGNKELVKNVSHLVKTMGFVFRTDIKGYFSNIDKTRLFEKLEVSVNISFVLNILHQYVFYSVEESGYIRDTKKGICRGCGLSYILAGFHLHSIDARFEHHSVGNKLFYTRYMDDFLILSEKRHLMKQGVKIIKSMLAEECLMLAPQKTQIGRVDKGFDWLGIWFDHTGLVGASPRALANRDKKLALLTPPQRDIYLMHWHRWLKSYR